MTLPFFIYEYSDSARALFFKAGSQTSRAEFNSLLFCEVVKVILAIFLLTVRMKTAEDVALIYLHAITFYEMADKISENVKML